MTVVLLLSLLLVAIVAFSDGFVSPQQRVSTSLINHNKLPYETTTLLRLFDKDSNNDSSEPILSPGPVSSLLLPAAQVLEDSTDGWALSYADLSPETEQTAIGQVFLATNVAYTAMGLYLQSRGDVWLGSITELASVASFFYHYHQLASPTNVGLVRLSLLVDYIVAAACLSTTLYYVIHDFGAMPMEGLVACFLACVFLGMSWIWEKGLPYCFNHGMWHLLGAYGGYVIGQAHISCSTAATAASAVVVYN